MALCSPYRIKSRGKKLGAASAYSCRKLWCLDQAPPTVWKKRGPSTPNTPAAAEKPRSILVRYRDIRTQQLCRVSPHRPRVHRPFPAARAAAGFPKVRSYGLWGWPAPRPARNESRRQLFSKPEADAQRGWPRPPLPVPPAKEIIPLCPHCHQGRVHF